MEVVGTDDVEEVELRFGGEVFLQIAGSDRFRGGGGGIEIDDELDAVVGVELVWGILFDDEVFTGKPGGFANPAAKPVVDIGNDLEGVVAMGVGDAIGEEDGRDAIPQVEVGPEGARRCFHSTGNFSHNIQLFWGRCGYLCGNHFYAWKI